jgi:hypothetical protein
LLAGLALAYGALTRETVMVAVGAIAIVRIIGLIRARRAPGRDEQAWVLPGVVFAAWQLVIYAVTGSLALATDSGRNAGLPFAAPLRALAHNARHMTADVSGQYDLWVFELAALVFVVTAAIVTMRANGPGGRRGGAPWADHSLRLQGGAAAARARMTATVRAVAATSASRWADGVADDARIAH